MSVAVLSPAGTAPATAATLADLDESALVERAKSGDSEACGELFRRNWSDVHRSLCRRLRDFPADVDDVAAQVFMTAWEQIQRYEDRGRPFVAWLNALARFKAMQHRRWRTSRREYALEVPNAASAEVRALLRTNPEDEAILRLELRHLLRSLPARRRLALVLRDWAGCSYDEIARALKLTPHAADALITNARRAAREAALSERALADRTTCECGCGRPVADSANGSRRFATEECWRQAEYERRWGRRPRRREAA